MLKSTKWKFIKQFMRLWQWKGRLVQLISVGETVKFHFIKINDDYGKWKEGENNDSQNFFHIYFSQNDSL